MSERTAEGAGSVLRVAMVSSDSSFRSLVGESAASPTSGGRMVCDAETAVAGMTRGSLDELLSRRPDVLFVDLDDRTEVGARFISAVTSRSRVAVVAAGSPVESEELLALVRAGAMEYLPRPLNVEEMNAAWARVCRRLDPVTNGREVGKGRLIALFSPGGGTGVTTTAVNLAVHVRSATRKRVLLLDLSDGMGSAGLLLGLEPRYSYVDAVESLHRMDQRLLDSILEEHESGTWLLSSPLDVEEGRAVAPEKIGRLLEVVRGYCDYTVIDLGRGIDRVARRALRAADERILLTTADLPALRNVKRVLSSVLPSGGEDDGDGEGEGIRLIVNRYHEATGLSRKEIERAVGRPVSRMLPRDDGPVLRSVNLGHPIVSEGSSPFSAGVRGLGDRLAAADLPETNGKGPVRRFIQTLLSPFSGQRNPQVNGTSSETSASRVGGTKG